MSKKNHAPGPVPEGNKPKHGPGGSPPLEDEEKDTDVEAGFNNQDPERRLGDYGGAGEHPKQHYSD